MSAGDLPAIRAELLLLPDGPIDCCGGPTSFRGAQPGPASNACTVFFSCPRCQRTTGDVVPLGAPRPTEGHCWSCGGARDAALCSDCGLPAEQLDRIAAFVRSDPDPAAQAVSLLERGYYRTGLALLHCVTALKPADPHGQGMRRVFIAGMNLPW